MTNKKTVVLRLVTIIAIIALMMTALASFTACGGDSGTKYAITWNVDQNAQVSVEGFSGLPTSVSEDTSISLTITAKTGYVVDTVRVNNKLIASKNGVYTFSVGKEMTIDVTVAKAVSSVEITSNPTLLTYYAGEKLDQTGMAVKVNYELGDSETITDYSIEYTSGNAFSIGDTSFAVSYQDKTSDAVQLTSAVECKVVLNTNNGSVSTTYYDSLSANEDIHNLKTEAGVVSFTYTSLSADISLPTSSDISKGDEGDFTFVGWSADDITYSSIATTNATSLTLEAAYNAQLLVLESIHFENKTITENNEQVRVPYLIISGEFKAAKTAYLYLYEGNDDIELVGDTVGNDTTQRGDKFDLEFDLRKLVEKGYIGKWMDIKFRAQLGEIEEQMEINLNDYPADFVNTDQFIVNGTHSFSFKIWENTLKAVYEDYVATADYTMTAGVDDEGNPTVTFEGQTSLDYVGKTVNLDWEFSSYINEYAIIGSDGAWSITFVLDDRFPISTDGYAHFKIIESESDPTVLYQDGDNGNLPNINCINSDLETVSIGLIENSGSIKCPSEDNTRVYYIGKGKWGGIVMYGRNEAIQTTGVSVESKNSVAYMVISGTYGSNFTDTAVVERIKSTMYADFTNCDAVNSLGWTAYPLSLGDEETPATILVEAADGTWKVYLDLSAGQVGEALFAHYGSSATNLVSDNVTKTPVTVGDKVYTADVYTGWDSNLVIVNITEAE